MGRTLNSPNTIETSQNIVGARAQQNANASTAELQVSFKSVGNDNSSSIDRSELKKVSGRMRMLGGSLGCVCSKLRAVARTQTPRLPRSGHLPTILTRVDYGLCGGVIRDHLLSV